jgi:methionyl-tRNA formyltransferase
MSEQNIRIGWVGFHVEGVPALRGLLESGVRLEGVITLDEKSLAKRSATVDYPALLASYDAPLHTVKNINDPESVALLRSMNLDLLIVIGWSQILKPEALQTAKLGVIGAHASPLPHNRGSAPVNWTLIKGEELGGNTLMWLSEGVDEGNMVDQMTFPVTPYDTCATLYDKVAETNRQMILRLLPKLYAGEKPSTPQEHTDEEILPRRRPTDGLLDWSQPAQKVYDFVRALTRPYPGAFSFMEGKKWLIQSCALLPAHNWGSGEPGTVVGVVCSPVAGACGQVVLCGEGAVLILDIEDEEGEVLTGYALSDLKWTGKVWNNG